MHPALSSQISGAFDFEKMFSRGGQLLMRLARDGVPCHVKFSPCKVSSEGAIYSAPIEGFTVGWKENGTGPYDKASSAEGCYFVASLLGLKNVLPCVKGVLKGKTGLFYIWAPGNPLSSHDLRSHVPSSLSYLFQLLVGNPDGVLKDPRTPNTIIFNADIGGKNVSHEFWIDNHASFNRRIEAVGVPAIVSEIMLLNPDALMEFCKKVRKIPLRVAESGLSALGLSHNEQEIFFHNVAFFNKLHLSPEKGSQNSTEGKGDTDFLNRLNTGADALDAYNEAILGRNLQAAAALKGKHPFISPSVSELDLWTQSIPYSLEAVRTHKASSVANLNFRPVSRLALEALPAQGISIQGADHLYNTQPNQDCFYIQRTEGCTVGVVADGYSSAQFSNLGAKHLARLFAHHANDLCASLRPKDSIVQGNNLAHLHATILRDLYDFAAGWRVAPYAAYKMAFASTLVGCVVREHETVVLSIGDGFYSYANRIESIPSPSPRLPGSIAMSMGRTKAEMIQLRNELRSMQRIRTEGGFSISREERELEDFLAAYDCSMAFKILLRIPTKDLKHTSLFMSTDGIDYADITSSSTKERYYFPMRELIRYTSNDTRTFEDLSRLIQLYQLACAPDYIRLNINTINKLLLIAQFNESDDNKMRPHWNEIVSKVEGTAAAFDIPILDVQYNDLQASVRARTKSLLHTLSRDEQFKATPQRARELELVVDEINTEISAWAFTKFCEQLRRSTRGAVTAPASLLSLQPLHDDTTFLKVGGVEDPHARLMA